MQIMEQNDIYMCPKHNQIIQLIVMEKGIKPADQMLCLECMNENRSPSNNIFSVKQAKEMIKEQLTLKFKEQEESIKQQWGKIQTIQKTLIEFRQNAQLSEVSAYWGWGCYYNIITAEQWFRIMVEMFRNKRKHSGLIFNFDTN